jgi:hypothetical protein
MEIPKEKLLDNTDLYEIPEDRKEAIINAPENMRKDVSDAELDTAYKLALDSFKQWEESVSDEFPEGDRKHLQAIQTIVEGVDRALAFKYVDTMGIDRQMIFKPQRLNNLDDATLKNRLELQ